MIPAFNIEQIIKILLIKKFIYIKNYDCNFSPIILSIPIQIDLL